MSGRSIGQRAEDLYCYGFKPGETLAGYERAAMVEYARTFEECSYSREELVAMDDRSLVSALYCVMADYASGQV